MTTTTSEFPAQALQTEPLAANRAGTNRASADIDRCLEELTSLAQSELSVQEYYAALLDRALRILPAVGGAAWQVVSGRAELLVQMRFPQALMERQRPIAIEKDGTDGHKTFCVPAYARASDSYPIDHPYPWPLIVCPLAIDDRDSVVVEVALDRDLGGDVQVGAAQLVGVLGEIAGDFHRRRELQCLRQRESRHAQFAQVVSRFHAQLDPTATAYAIANDGRQWIGCDRLSVLRLRHGRAIALAVSAVDRVDRRSEQVAALELLAAAVAASGDPLLWRGGGLEDIPPQLASVLQSYLDIGHARQVMTFPLRAVPTDALKAVPPAIGILVAESFAEDLPLPTLMSGRAGDVARAGSPALANALTHHALPLRSLQERLANLLERISRRPLAVALGSLALATLIVLLAVIPADFSVPAEGTVQPQVRRNLFAPADGVVAEVRAEHGERVAAGDVLLRIRNPSLDLEQSRLSGELQTAQAKLDAVRSTRSRPGNSPATGEQDRLASEEEQLKEQIQGLEDQRKVLGQLRGELDVTSPLHGIVLTWNTRQLLSDRPVKQGHTLLTVADPAGPWVLELRVKDAQIGQVLASQRTGSASLPVRYLLASDPALTHHGVLESLALATDTVEGESAADAVVTLNDVLPEGVRAGSRVIARIHCGRRSIGYVWFHDLIDFVRTSLLF